MKQKSAFALLINTFLKIFILLDVVCFAQNRISSQKCAEYQSSCPIVSDPFNIHGGEAASKEFPHMAAIGYENVYKNNGIHWLCTGSLISMNFILSTAECTRRVGSLIPKYVRLGDSDIRSFNDDARPQQFNIIETFAHPSHSPGPKYNDIALFKIDGPVIFSEYMRPACLSTFKPDNEERVLVTGWGTITYATATQGFEYAQMQKIPMNTITNTECNQVFANRDTIALPNGIDQNTQICASSGLGERDACRGFSGAPLLNTKEKRSCLYEIYGLNSISLVCGSGYPSVYTQVSAFLDWIENIVWLNGTGTVLEIPTTHPTTTKSPKADRTFVKKCNEYHNSMFGANRIEQNVCTFAVSPYIVDGEQAEAKEFPHMVSRALVGFDGKNQIAWACGGTLISEKFVLTAAHCLNATEYGVAKYVLLGDLDYSRDDDDARPLQLNVAEQIKYPAFTSKYKYNDIGLLRLETVVTFNEYIWPACLPEFTAIGFQATATGWGRLDNSGPISSRLRKVELDLYSHKECDDLYTAIKSRQIDRGILNDTQLCAGSHSGRGDTCQGDSGGPLQKFHDSLTCMYTIVGVTSFGQYCGSQKPGVYTRVYSYVDWIEGIVWPN